MNASPAIAARRSLDSVMRRFRSRRMQQFGRLFALEEHTRILDVGGTSGNWRLLDQMPRITLLNTPRGQETLGPGFEYVSGDGCALPFSDRSFDIVFSNSVIEHVGDPAKQQRFAEEIRRVGRQYWVQTPNRWFPLEPHLLTPFLQFLPYSWQRAVVHRGSVWEWIERPSPDRRAFYLEHYLNDIRLLGHTDMVRLFPGAEIVRERYLGLTKSLIAVRRVMSE